MDGSRNRYYALIFIAIATNFEQLNWQDASSAEWHWHLASAMGLLKSVAIEINTVGLQDKED
ncbi:MAG: hypothetical protein F6K47_23060 [Symploca sp. SIO2E6]|nr:hypothetical protein [Symploca sp. SIO2E6]